MDLDDRPAGGTARYRRGFWLVAVLFAVIMAFATVPTPLWPIYRATEGMSPLTVTVAFAVYAVGVLVSLFLAGHVSDWLGRRRLLAAALAVEVVSAVLFLAWPGTTGVLVARLLSGVGVGMATATATAYLAELHLMAWPQATLRRAGRVSTAANIGGLGLGALCAGVLVQFLPYPLLTPYAVFLALLALLLVALPSTPETVRRDPGVGYRPQRVVVPADARWRYFGAAAAGFATFMTLGLFTCLAPILLGILGVSSPALGGVAVFVVFLVAALSQLLVEARPPAQQMRVGLPLLGTGGVVLAAGLLADATAVFVLGALLSGAGIGFTLKGALGTAVELSSAAQKGEATAGIFLGAYLGITLPIVGIGLLTTAGVALPDAVTAFTATMLAVIVAARLLMRSGRPDPARRPAG